MASSRIFSLAITFVALLAITPLAKATCYVAAYGLIEEEDGWKACPGTASKAGGIETCCMPGSECGEDSLCRVPDSDNPGNNAWYQAGCTDSTYTDSVCRNSCGMFFDGCCVWWPNAILTTGGSRSRLYPDLHSMGGLDTAMDVLRRWRMQWHSHRHYVLGSFTG